MTRPPIPAPDNLFVDEWTARRSSDKLTGVPFADVLARLDPLEQHAVTQVYFEGRTTAEVARALEVERSTVTAALAAVHRRIARWVMDETGPDETTLPGLAPAS